MRWLLLMLSTGCGAAQPGPISPDACAPPAATPREGECCGGPSHIQCAEGLTCYFRYRYPESIGTCMQPRG